MKRNQKLTRGSIFVEKKAMCLIPIRRTNKYLFKKINNNVFPIKKAKSIKRNSVTKKINAE